ncbi:MAG: N-acetyltransferase [Nitrospiraceae bacterium]|nr:MAG: N-acetyltransferase [Nitrospiraceae bacterium]
MKVIEVKTGKGLDAFIKFPLSLYSKNPFYVTPLIKELKEQFSDKNPFFNHAKVRYFIAERDGKCAGRIISIVNRRHAMFHKDKAGFFGFFECVNDVKVSSALLDTAAEELGKQGMEIVRGPMNFSTNEECGFLISNFEEYPMLMTPYNMPYYAGLMEGCGLHKAKDLYAYIYDVKDSPPEKVLRVAAIAEKRGVTVRPVDKKKFSDEMKVFKEIYNSAWENNWGFIPLTDDEIDYMGSRLRQIVVPELTLIAEDNGKPVGFLGLLPDFNSVLAHMNGRLNPVTIMKAFYYSKKIKDLRLLLLGIKKDYRNKGVDAILFREGFKGIKKGGYKRVEFSWILEDNIPVQRIVEMTGGKLYKQYRIYEKRL